MATSTRPPPPLRSAGERRARLTKSPAAMTDEVENHTQNALSHSTRRSSRTTPLLALNDEHASPKPAPQHSTKATSLSRSNSKSRKRPATALTADATITPNTRPPTKVIVTQPHGQLLSITNGVSHPLPIAHEYIAPSISTPTANGGPIAGGLTVPASAQSAATQTSDKRSLRSHDGGSRLKSDLAIYFSNYDDIIAGVPTPPEFLAVDTPIYIVDEPFKPPKSPAATAPESSRASVSPSRSRKSITHTSIRRPSYVVVPPSQSSTTYQTLEYGSIIAHVRNYDDQDPLADAVYVVQHRRAERKEKQLRNIEKERAMHEKVQLERLLDGLQGHDWLKVMGITGVTDGERKDWEPKRDYFVKEVETLVDKFRIWKEEEKRLRSEKEAALALASREEDEEEGEEDDTSDSDAPNSHVADQTTAERHREKEPQLPKPRRPPRPHGYVLPPPPPEPLPPFTSFYSKPHLRAAALGKHRHGRNASAFGQPIPDFDEHEFDLPEDYLTYEFLRDHARKRRRQKRESGVNT
ncbi:something about silencing, SAS, complex subunit 4-domain-containing protein [Dendryphion nanum]|uniref:Something about silencing, SAS, complex subunit 4-domain-containing protein n=1 Tax=Dendryphion nanum TaxID=256645 RepID=A0A9P9IKM0_9PLEO|nr:something about silencing, SAS, complex subunit 4-domain-containing protein [Dendryphion nanum]